MCITYVQLFMYYNNYDNDNNNNNDNDDNNNDVGDQALGNNTTPNITQYDHYTAPDIMQHVMMHNMIQSII